MLDVHKVELFSLRTKIWQYRGEGNANLVLALPEERKIVRLRKCKKGEVEENGDQTESERIWRETIFCRGVMAPLLGHCYVQTPTAAYLERSELRLMDQMLRSQRPVNRHHKGLHLGYMMVYPDYALLPVFLASSSSTSPTFCVEVKPKQGWLPLADRRLPKCTYCLNQFLKLKNGSIRCRSHYCPLDLFSGNTVRMKKALQSLLVDPQNNLKIFQDGVLVYGDGVRGDLNWILQHWFPNEASSLHRLEDKLCSLIVEALCRDISAPLKLQAFRCKYDQQEIKKEGSPLPERIPSSLVSAVATLLMEVPCNWASEPLPRDCILSRILDIQRLEQSGSDRVYNAYRSVPHLPSDDFTYVSGLLTSSLLNPIERYLLATTAKDCSIMIAFQKVASPTSDQIPAQHLAQDLDKVFYKFSVGVSDLDPKPLSCIEKHRKRDCETLLACLEIFQPSSKLISTNKASTESYLDAKL